MGINLSWLRTFRGATQDEAELAAMAADEIERLQKGIVRLAELADDTSTEFFNGYLADELRKLVGK